MLLRLFFLRLTPWIPASHWESYMYIFMYTWTTHHTMKMNNWRIKFDSVLCTHALQYTMYLWWLPYNFTMSQESCIILILLFRGIGLYFTGQRLILGLWSPYQIFGTSCSEPCGGLHVSHCGWAPKLHRGNWIPHSEWEGCSSVILAQQSGCLGGRLLSGPMSNGPAGWNNGGVPSNLRAMHRASFGHCTWGSLSEKQWCCRMLWEGHTISSRKGSLSVSSIGCMGSQTRLSMMSSCQCRIKSCHALPNWVRTGAITEYVVTRTILRVNWRWVYIHVHTFTTSERRPSAALMLAFMDGFKVFLNGFSFFFIRNSCRAMSNME